jgi:hypothetical protein
MTLSITDLFVTLSINVTPLSLMTLYTEFCYADCRYVECRYAECRFAECRGAAGTPSILLVKGGGGGIH